MLSTASTSWMQAEPLRLLLQPLLLEGVPVPAPGEQLGSGGTPGEAWAVALELASLTSTYFTSLLAWLELVCAEGGDGGGVRGAWPCLWMGLHACCSRL